MASNATDINEVWGDGVLHVATAPVPIAAELVRRYNCHEQLLAALKDVRDNVTSDSPAMWSRVDAAVAAAEK